MNIQGEAEAQIQKHRLAEGTNHSSRMDYVLEPDWIRMQNDLVHRRIFPRTQVCEKAPLPVLEEGIPLSKIAIHEDLRQEVSAERRPFYYLFLYPDRQLLLHWQLQLYLCLSFFPIQLLYQEDQPGKVRFSTKSQLQQLDGLNIRNLTVLL